MDTKNKISLRKKHLQKRDKLTPVVRARDSAIIRQRVFGLREWKDVHTILTYVSFRSEVETHKLIQEAFSQGKRVIVPVIDSKEKEIHLSELKAVGDLAPGSYAGIYEPPALLRKRVLPLEVELALIPGAVFDREGGRVGLGGGYFDKLLAKMPHAHRIGLAYSIQIQKASVPREPHDVGMHVIVTEKEVIKVKR